MRSKEASFFLSLGRSFSTAITSTNKSLADAHLPSAVHHLNDIVADSASGSWIQCTDGRRYLDFTSGIGVTSTGHSHPKVVRAIQDQAARVIFAQQNCVYTHTAQLGLIERLKKVVPAPLDTFFFVNSGAEAVENAIKIARAETGRLHVLCFENAFHGRTLGALSVTTSKNVYRYKFGPLVPGILVAPYPYCLHCTFHRGGQLQSCGRAPNGSAPTETSDRSAPQACCLGALEAIDRMFKQQTVPEDVAAILLEPILGEGGFLLPPPGFLRSLRALCDQHGILLIFDEIQSGVGRTGSWWAHAQFDGGVTPDLMLFAKGIGSGMPIAGLAAGGAVFEGLPGASLGGTFGANPVCCAAASATIDAIEEEGMVQNAAARGAQLRAGLDAIAKEFSSAVIEVRGRGLMQAVEFDTRRVGMAGNVSKASFKHGMLLMTAGSRETVRFLPALNVREEEVERGLEAFRGALKDVGA